MEKVMKNIDKGTLTSILSLTSEGEEEERQKANVIMQR